MITLLSILVSLMVFSDVVFSKKYIVVVKSYGNQHVTGERADGTKIRFQIERLAPYYRQNLHLYLNKEVPVLLSPEDYHVKK